MKSAQAYVQRILPKPKAKKARSIWTGEPHHLRLKSLCDYFEKECRGELQREGLSGNLLAWLLLTPDDTIPRRPPGSHNVQSYPLKRVD